MCNWVHIHGLISFCCWSFWLHVGHPCPELERLSGWVSWSSLETLRARFNVSSDDHDSHLDDLSVSVKRKCRHIVIFLAGWTNSCQNDNFLCSQWRKFRQNYISASLYTCIPSRKYKTFISSFKFVCRQTWSTGCPKTNLSGMFVGHLPASVLSVQTSPIIEIQKLRQDYVFIKRIHSSIRSDNFVYAPSQGGTTLHCNVVPHWLGAYTDIL